MACPLLVSMPRYRLNDFTHGACYQKSPPREGRLIHTSYATTSSGVTNSPECTRELPGCIALPQQISVDPVAFCHQTQMDSDDSRKSNNTAGRLAIFLKFQGAAGEANAWSHVEDLEGAEWVALFRDILNCPVGISEPRPLASNPAKQYEMDKALFQQALKDYPMLGRIWDTYVDVTYLPSEVGQLLNECLALQPAAASNQTAREGLSKLIQACNEALSNGAGLELSSD